MGASRNFAELFITFKDSMSKSLAVLSVILMLFSSGCSVNYLAPHTDEGGVRFSLKAPGAKQVALVGDFNQWDAGRDLLKGPDSEQVWTITIPLAEGRYEYMFLLDGEKWVLDPEVPFSDDSLGGKNSVFVLRTQ
ncbi:MAG: isoamylase early set domain-containing protein [Thermodesulfovibrionales bacterium]